MSNKYYNNHGSDNNIVLPIIMMVKFLFDIDYCNTLLS